MEMRCRQAAGASGRKGAARMISPRLWLLLAQDSAKRNKLVVTLCPKRRLPTAGAVPSRLCGLRPQPRARRSSRHRQQGNSRVFPDARHRMGDVVRPACGSAEPTARHSPTVGDAEESAGRWKKPRSSDPPDIGGMERPDPKDWARLHAGHSRLCGGDGQQGLRRCQSWGGGPGSRGLKY